MKFLVFFIAYLISFGVIYWIIRKINLRFKLLNIFKKVNIKYARGTSILVFILSAFLIEYGKQSLNELYGRDNYMSIILSAISFNLMMLIFDGDK